jgi:cysteinyl-tRNA synthetase
VEQTAHDTQFAERMDDDFNCAGAMAILHAIAGEINQQRRDGDEQAAAASAAVLVRLGSVLGLLQQNPELFFQGVSGSGQSSELSAADIDAMIQARADARKARDFAGADRVRDQLLEQGIILDDSREGTSWRRG